MITVAIWAIGLTVLCCAAAVAQEKTEARDDPTSRTETAVWTSPFAGGTLTEGEYLILDRVRTTRLPRIKGLPPEELILARYQVGRDLDAFALGVVARSRDGYACRELLRDVTGYPRVRLLTRPTHPPVLMLETADGSGGFLALDLFQRKRDRWTYIDHREGLYQGDLRNVRETSRAVRYDVITRLAGPVNAFPRREYRERWVVSDNGLYRAHRVLLRHLPYVAGARTGAGVAKIPHDE